MLVQAGRRILHVDVFESTTGWTCAFATTRFFGVRRYIGKKRCPTPEDAARYSVMSWARSLKRAERNDAQYERELRAEQDDAAWREMRAEVGS